MAKPSTTEKSLPTLVNELRELIVAYAKQETLDPLKQLGRFLQYGVFGSVFLAVGFVLLALALLRALQIETYPHWAGDWSWVPYAITFAGSVVVAVGLGLMINADRRREGRRAKNKGA